MKIKELEEKINIKLAEVKLNSVENAVDNSSLMCTVHKIINSELVALEKESKNLYFSWLHRGNPYYGTNSHNYYSNLEIYHNKIKYSTFIRIEFILIRKKAKSYRPLWYVERIEVKINDYDQNMDFKTICANWLKDIKEKEKQREKERIEKLEEQKRIEQEREKFREEKKQELLNYISKNNLDLEEFKQMAEIYVLHLTNRI